MMTTRTIDRHSSQAPMRVRRSLKESLGPAFRCAAAVGRYALHWFGAYLMVAAILLLGWAFSS